MSDLETFSGSLPIVFSVGILLYLMLNFQKRGKILLDNVVANLETSRTRILYESEIEPIFNNIKKQEVQEEANLGFGILLFLTIFFRSILVPRFINHIEVYNLFAITIVLFGLIIYVLKMLAHKIVEPRLGIIICVGLIILFLESIFSIVLVHFYQS